MSKHKYSDQDRLAAKKWFSSLPVGRRNYFKQSYRLTNDDAIVRFWFNNIKEVTN